MNRPPADSLLARLRIRPWVFLLCVLLILIGIDLVLFRQPWGTEEERSEAYQIRQAYWTDELVQNNGPYRLRRVFEQVKFNRPLGMARSADGRWFVVEKRGRLYVFPDDPEAQSAKLLLDLGKRVDHEYPEEGLLNLALHPEFTSNGRLFLFYSASGERRNLLVEYRLDPSNPNRLLPGSERVVLTLRKTYTHHNGGGMLFGPADGLLYLTIGDGGGWGDPQYHGQDLETLFASMLRIDVDRREGGLAYGIPPDNPFATQPKARPEIWAYGLRNTWRFSFDRATGTLWAGDVGQDQWEEINIIRRGGNYGWNVFEGSQVFENTSGGPPTEVDPEEDYLPPVWEYDHLHGAAVVGGYVYRGDRLPALQGYYVFAEYAFGTIMALRYEGDQVVDSRILVRQPKNITSFAEGPDGEIYLLANSGEIFILEPRPMPFANDSEEND